MEGASGGMRGRKGVVVSRGLKELEDLMSFAVRFALENGHLYNEFMI